MDLFSIDSAIKTIDRSGVDAYVHEYGYLFRWLSEMLKYEVHGCLFRKGEQRREEKDIYSKSIFYDYGMTGLMYLKYFNYQPCILCTSFIYVCIYMMTRASLRRCFSPDYLARLYSIVASN